MQRERVLAPSESHYMYYLSSLSRLIRFLESIPLIVTVYRFAVVLILERSATEQTTPLYPRSMYK
jgi:hypothetical protein